MPTGTARKNSAASDLDHRDGLDAAIRKGLRPYPRSKSPKSRPAASQPHCSPSPNIPPKNDGLLEENLLRYVEGTLDSQEHAAFEAQLLRDPASCEQVALLKAALSEAQQDAPAPGLLTTARYVFHVVGGKLCFLRGSDEPRRIDPPLPQNGSSQPRKDSLPSLFHFTHHFGRFTTRLGVEPGRAGCMDLTLWCSEPGQARPFSGEVSFDSDGVDGGRRPVGRGAAFDDAGMRFAELPPGRYRLTVTCSTGDVGHLIVDTRLHS